MKTKERAGIRWHSVVEKVRKDIMRYEAEPEEIIEERERPALKNKVKSEKKTLRGIRGTMGKRRLGMETNVHGPLDFAKTLKLRFRVGDLDLPVRRKSYTTWVRCTDVPVRLSRIHTVGECEMNQGDRTGGVRRGDEGNRRM